MSLFSTVAENIKLIGGLVAGTVAMGGAYVTLDGPIPAMKHWVIAQVNTLKTDSDSKVGVLKAESVKRGLELNDMRRELLRKEKFDRTNEVAAPNVPAELRRLIQERLEVVNDRLADVERQRGELLKEQAGH